MFAKVFLVSNVPDRGLLRSVLCADNSTKALEPYAKNNGNEVDIRGGGKELFSGWSHLVEKAWKIIKPTTQFILAFKK